jgi:hypothetical protein
MVTIHPAAVLRSADEQARRRLYRTLVEDLQTAARLSEDPDMRSAPFPAENRLLTGPDEG